MQLHSSIAFLTLSFGASSAFLLPSPASLSSASRKLAFSEQQIFSHHHSQVDEDDNKETPESTTAARGIMSARKARIQAPLAALTTSGLLLPSLLVTTTPAPALAESSNKAELFDTALKTFASGAITSSVVNLRVMSTLRKKEYRPYNTLMATSLDDSDEINDTPQSLTSFLRKQLCESKDGGVAHLGGMGGLPFGLVDSSIDTLVSHCPKVDKDGRIVILFGPSMGISKDGTVGMVERVGSGGEATPCGAGYQIHKSLMGKDVSTSSATNLGDFQKQYVLQKLKGNASEWTSGDSNAAIASITRSLYSLGKASIVDQVQKSISQPGFWETTGVKEILLMGGIIVNRGHGSGTKGGEDYFQPLMMNTYTRRGEVNLYDEVFGDLLTPRNL